MHGTSILIENVSECIDSVEQMYTNEMLLFPTDDFDTLGRAAGSFVQWPKNLVTLKDGLNTNSSFNNSAVQIPKHPNPNNPNPQNPNLEKPNPQNPNPRKRNSLNPKSKIANSKKPCAKQPIPENQSANKSNFGNTKQLSFSCGLLRTAIQSKNDVEQIIIQDTNRALIHPSNTDGGVSIFLPAIKELLNGEKIESTIIEIFLLALIYGYKEAENFGFVNPTFVSQALWQSESRGDYSGYLAHTISKNKSKRFIFLPYNESDHWTLLVICMRKREVYIYDPLRRLNPERDLLIKPYLDKAFLSCSIDGESSKLMRARATTFNYIQGLCAKQPGSVECGYYVMRFMYDILLNHRDADFLLESYARTITYTQCEIDEVLDVFASHMLACLLNFKRSS